jgi:transketolase
MISKKKIASLNTISKKVRYKVIEMLNKSGSGHPGGSLSSADILVHLYFSDLIKFSKKNYKSKKRDVVILSAGHYCPTLYAILAYKKFFNINLLNKLRKFNSPLLGHPKLNELPGLENSGGSLGQGISLACGYALSAKNFKETARVPKVFCLMGDGEQNEGQVWESALFAAKYKLSNLCAIIDVNKIQIDGFTKDILNTEPLVEKYNSFNWRTVRINGHSHKSIYLALKKFLNYKGNKPTVIIADTIAGKGLPSIEGLVESHGIPINKDHLREIKS